MRELQRAEIEKVSGGHWNEDAPTGFTLRVAGQDFWVDSSDGTQSWILQGAPSGSGSGEGGIPPGYQQGSLTGPLADTNGDGELSGADYFTYTINSDGTVTAFLTHFGMWDENGDGIANDGEHLLFNFGFSTTSAVSTTVSEFSESLDQFIPLHTNNII